MKVLMKLWVAVFSAVVLVASPLAAAEQSPKEVVESTVQAIIGVLEARADKEKVSESDREGIRRVVVGKFDYREMSRRSVGRPWEDIKEAKKVEFTELFRQLLEYSYGNQLAGYNGQKVLFDDAEYKKDKARVQGEVIDANKSTPMEYRLYQTDIGWQVYDIKIEGISMVTTFRKDFGSIVDRQGIEGLMDTLRDKIEKLKAKA